MAVVYSFPQSTGFILYQTVKTFKHPTVMNEKFVFFQLSNGFIVKVPESEAVSFAQSQRESCDD